MAFLIKMIHLAIPGTVGTEGSGSIFDSGLFISWRIVLVLC